MVGEEKKRAAEMRFLIYFTLGMLLAALVDSDRETIVFDPYFPKR